MLNDKNFLKIAAEISTWSKCVSKHVWAVIVKDNRILSTWYNWTPAWYINCNDFFNWIHWPKHHDWAAKYEIHAEMNAIIWAARKWVNIEWATMYSTYQPCFDCTKNIVWSWIKRIVYNEKYKHYSWTEAQDFIEANWIELLQIDI